MYNLKQHKYFIFHKKLLCNIIFYIYREGDILIASIRDKFIINCNGINIYCNNTGKPIITHKNNIVSIYYSFFTKILINWDDILFDKIGFYQNWKYGIKGNCIITYIIKYNTIYFVLRDLEYENMSLCYFFLQLEQIMKDLMSNKYLLR